ncbi:TonB-dependent receptor domain-containing protein, partial [Bacteroidota bacterium]
QLQAGVNYKNYIINSEGTLFFDEPGEPINIYEYGGFVQLSKALFSDHLKLTASARYDKNEYFKGVFTPRISGVLTLDKEKLHNIRASWQSAFRFPSISDQWIDIDIGYYQGLGGLPVVQEKYDFFTNPVYPLSGSNPVLDTAVIKDGPFDIPEFGPERVQTMEIGYNGLILNKGLFIDAYVYKNNYTGFLANQLLAQNPYTPDEKRYRTVISTDEAVSSYGWAFGFDLGLPYNFYCSGNVVSNVLLTSVDVPGRETRFNSPKYRFNVSLGNRHLIKNLGFSINFRWQDAFLWQSNFGIAEIPAYLTLDAQVNYKLSLLKSVIKIGGSNLLNNYYTTSFGTAQIGGLYYISWTFDQFLN